MVPRQVSIVVAAFLAAAGTNIAAGLLGLLTDVVAVGGVALVVSALLAWLVVPRFFADSYHVVVLIVVGVVAAVGSHLLLGTVGAIGAHFVAMLVAWAIVAFIVAALVNALHPPQRSPYPPR